MGKKASLSKIKLAALIWILTVGVLYFIIYIAPGVTDIFIESYIAEYGTIDVEHEIEYICVRNERIHTADNTGKVKRIIEAGNLVRNNSKIMSVGGMNYYSRIRGIVSYVYDNLEKKYSVDNLDDLKSRDIEVLKRRTDDDETALKPCASETANVGDPIYKIVDNSVWYFVSFMTEDNLNELAEGRSVRIKIGEQDEMMMPFKTVFIERPEENTDDSEIGEETEAADEEESMDTASKKYKVIFSCDRYYENFDKLRYGKAKLVTSRKTGMILETSSIVEEDGQKGVYVLNKYNNYVFTPISIIAEIGDKTVVENRLYYDPKTEKMVDTVKNYDSIKKGDSNNVNKG